MKQSEYDVVEQLKKTPARISLLSLVLTSELHRKALLKILDEAYVKPDVTPQCMVNMVDPIKHVSSITFSDEEVVSQSEKNPRALHITLKCKGFIVSKVLIDGGSALNVLPRSTLTQLSMSTDDLTPQVMVVRAFDGTKRDILGEVVLSLEIGPSKFQVLFQVMEIEPAYTMLLGRPWIHAAGAVPSTLHQKIKYIEKGSLITVHGEEEIMVSKPVSVPYVDNAEQEEKNLCHSFEVIELGESSARHVNQIVARIMAKNGYQEGKGLGSQLQGDKRPVTLPEKFDRLGLGYEKLFGGKFQAVTFKRKDKKSEVQRIPHLRETFPAPAEVIMSEEAAPPRYRLTINTLDEEVLKECDVITPSLDQELLKNWESKPIIDVVASK